MSERKLKSWTCPKCGFGPQLVDAELPVRCFCEAVPIEEIALAALPEEDRQLLGDRVHDLLAAIGIPACSGCESRRQWLNAAHRWLLGG
jgi:hypothetical protein